MYTRILGPEMCKKMTKNDQNRAKSLQIARNIQNPQKSLFFQKFEKCLEGLYGHEKSENYQKCQKSLFFHLNNDISKHVEGYTPITTILYMLTFTDTLLAHLIYIYIYIYIYTL